MTTKTLAESMKDEMIGMSIPEKDEYLQKKYLELWEIPMLADSYSVGVFLVSNFKAELEQIKQYKKERKV